MTTESRITEPLSSVEGEVQELGQAHQKGGIEDLEQEDSNCHVGDPDGSRLRASNQKPGQEH